MVVCFALLAPLALGSTFARAQGTGDTPHRLTLAESLTGAAKEAYDAAGILLNNRDLAGAITKYRQAYDLSKDPRLLFDMAVCERDLRAYAKMRELLLRYEQEAGADVSAEQKADIDDALAAIHSLVAAVRVTASEVGAAVAVDGEAVGVTPLATPLVIDLGKHTISLRKSGFEPVDRSVDLAGGNEMTLSITLVAQAQHTAQLRVAADVDATVVVDRKQASRGGFEGTLPAGVHVVQVTAPGKTAYDVQVDLRDGESRTLSVTLASERRGPGIWPWVIGGAVVVAAAGAVVGGYYLLKSPDHATTPESGLPPVILNMGSP
jgi:hypothetical protein